MNEYDSGIVEDILRRKGYDVIKKDAEAEVVIVNTCSVRRHAEERAYGYMREIAQRKKKKDITIIVMGCMAQREGEKLLKEIPGLDIICGVDNFEYIGDMLEDIRRKRNKYIALSRRDKIMGDKVAYSIPRNRLKGYVAVMRGCNNFCSYCVVPGARGKEKSRTIRDIVDEVERLVESGVKEVTLLGQNINAYGRDNGADLVSLLTEVNNIQGLYRIRFITSHPRDIKQELFWTVKNLDKVMEYIHLPLQAGSDKILELMNRRYTVSQYMDIVRKMREIIPDVSIGTDLIVGFPGETERDFKETLKITEEMQFDMAYMYKYSPRPGTRAFGMSGAIKEDIIRERHKVLLKLQEKISLRKNQAFIGKKVEVLVEGRSKRNIQKLSGRDRGNRIVVFEGSDDLIGHIVNVNITGATSLTLYGEIE